MLLGPAASSDSGGLLIIPVYCDVAAGQPWLPGFREGNGGGETECSVIGPASQRPSTAVCGEGATQNSRQKRKAMGRKEHMVLRLCGGPGWFSRLRASSRCFRLSRLEVMFRRTGICLYPCERLRRTSAVGLGTRSSSRRHNPTAWHRAPLEGFFCMCIPLVRI